MKYYNILNGPREASAVILGCMRMPALTVEQAAAMLRAAHENGVNFFDHATCYGQNGAAEARFGDAFPLSGLRREDVYIQSKCGLVFERGEFDWTKENILESVDGSLSRLKTDYLDVLLLHRPDPLFDPEEVAAAFDALYESGKVRFFGVSNLSTLQIALLQKYVRQKLIFNQLQFSLDQSMLIDQAFYMNNMTTERSVDRDNGTLDYCRLHDITVQCWSPLQHGFFKGCFVDDPDFPELNRVLGELGEKYGVSKTAVAIAWILRHPAKMMPIAGTMNPAHLAQICEAAGFTLTHPEWYRLYLASGKFLP